MKTSVKWTLGCGGAAVFFFCLLSLLFALLFFSLDPNLHAFSLYALIVSAALAILSFFATIVAWTVQR